MNTPTPLLSDLLAMTAMRIASNGRVITRVTAELELSRVTAAVPPPLHNFNPKWLRKTTSN